MNGKLDLAASAALTAASISLMAFPAAAVERDVAAFGVRCDGRTDDTAALGRVFAALDRGDVLAFPRGATCLFSGRLRIDNKTGYEIAGSGAALKVAGGTPKDAGPMVRVERNRDFAWRDLTVDGNRDNRDCSGWESADQSARYHNIVVAESEDFVFERVRSTGSCMDGFYLIASRANPTDRSTYSRRGRFVEVEAIGNVRNGLSIINAEDIEVVGGSYSGNKGTWPMAGIDLEPNGGPAPAIRNITISGARIVGNVGRGVNITDHKAPVDGVVVRGNYFSDDLRGGLFVAADRVTVEDNLFEGFTRTIEEVYGPRPEPLDRIETLAPLYVRRGAGHEVRGNTLRGVRLGSIPAVHVERHVGAPAAVEGNCFGDVEAEPALLVEPGAGRVTVAEDNRFDPSGGCPDPRRDAGAGEPVAEGSRPAHGLGTPGWRLRRD